MSYMKSRLKLAAILAVIILAAGGVGFWILRDSPQSTTTQNPSNNSTQDSNNKNRPSSQAPQPATSDTADFTYQKPADWVNLPQKQLTASGATNGITLPDSNTSSSTTPPPLASFTVKVSDATPQNAADQKSATLSELQKLSNFELLSSTGTTVNGKSGQIFIYTFGNQDKTKQELRVVVNKQKTFFLLFSSAESNFSKYNADFAKILSSFKFK